MANLIVETCLFRRSLSKTFRKIKSNFAPNSTPNRLILNGSGKSTLLNTSARSHKYCVSEESKINITDVERRIPGLNAPHYSSKSIGKEALTYLPRIKNNTLSGVDQKVQSYKVVLPKNMSLRHCPLNTNQECNGVSRHGRPLTLLLAWMLSEEKNLEKYRQMWFRRGFDVLTVRISPLDFLVPPIGSKVVAKNLINVISRLIPEYNEIVVHAFSVGAYQFGETLLQLKEQEQLKVDNLIKGIICDSVVYTNEAAMALSVLLTGPSTFQPILERSISAYFKLFHHITIKNFENAIQEIIMPSFKWPGLIFYSKDDIVSCVKTHEEVVTNWRKVENEIRSKCWDVSAHVSHYKHHQKEYEQELDAFLKSLKLRNCAL